MLNKILFLTKGELKTRYHIIYNNKEASSGDTLVVTDNEIILKKYSTQDFAVLFVSDKDEFIDGAKFIIDDLKNCDDEYLEIVFARCKGLPVKVFETDTDQQNYINGEFDRPNITIVRHKKQTINVFTCKVSEVFIIFVIAYLKYNI